MAQQLRERLRERSGMFQYSDLSDIGPVDNPENNPSMNNPDNQTHHTSNHNTQPEEEPNRKISIDITADTERLRIAQETPVPESPASAPPVGGSLQDEASIGPTNSDTDEARGSGDEPMETEARASGDVTMEPVYNAVMLGKCPEF